jgi:hypothetical protein
VRERILETENIEIGLDPLPRLSRDLRDAAIELSDDEARFLVDSYYNMQEQRIRGDAQVRALEKTKEPHRVLAWYAEQSERLEKAVRGALDVYSASKPLGQWARNQDGIGPVLAAGLLAHIDIARCTSAGDIWRFAGLDPTQTWGKGKKRPWNAGLKTLCWKIGESFVKVCNKDTAFYGHLYKQRKERETLRNEAGDFADQAKAKLEKFNIDKKTDAYKAYSVGKLPPAHIHARAKRYAVKLFLAHYFETGCRLAGREPPLPYPIAHLDHVHRIAPPE